MLPRTRSEPLLRHTFSVRFPISRLLAAVWTVAAAEFRVWLRVILALLAYCARGIVKLKIKQASGNADIAKVRQLDVKCP